MHNHPLRVRGIVVAVLLASSLSCGRFGYQATVDGEVGAALPGIPPFGDSDTALVELAEDGARLATTAGFAVQDSRLPVAVSSTAASGFGAGICLAGGSSTFPDPGSCSRDLFVYDPVADQLSVEAELVDPNQGMELVHHSDGSLYSIMGYCGIGGNEAMVFRHSLDSLDPVPVGAYPLSAYFHTSDILRSGDGSELLVSIGGVGSGPLRAEIQWLDPSDGNSGLADATLPTPRCLSAGAVHADTFFVFGGSTEADCLPPVNSSTLYLTEEIIAVTLGPDQAQVVGALPEPMAAGCAVAREDGTILVFGGMRYRGEEPNLVLEPVRTIYVFNPGDASVTEYPAQLPEARASLACAMTDTGHIILAGGAGPNLQPSDEILLFEPYASSGEITHRPLDSGLDGAQWTGMRVEVDAPDDTAVRFEIRIGDDIATLDDDADWTAVDHTAPLPENLRTGRYLQWRATLESNNPALTPVLYSVIFSYRGIDSE